MGELIIEIYGIYLFIYLFLLAASVGNEKGRAILLLVHRNFECRYRVGQEDPAINAAAGKSTLKLETWPRLRVISLN